MIRGSCLFGGYMYNQDSRMGLMYIELCIIVIVEE